MSQVNRSQNNDQSVSSEADRHHLAEQYLSALRDLSTEVDSAIAVLVVNSLPEFQEHVARQEFLTSRVQELSKELADNASPKAASDSKLWNEIHSARQKLAELNRRYSTFLQYSWRYIGTMTELCRAYEEDGSTAAIAAPAQQAVSCEV